MLGEVAGTERVRMSGVRVLEGGSSPRFEVSFQGAGRLFGDEASDVGTYVASLRPDGNFYGEGQGVVTTANGDVLTWKGQGVGRPRGGRAVSWRGALYYETASEKYRHANETAYVYEFEVGDDGSVEATLYEWK